MLFKLWADAKLGTVRLNRRGYRCDGGIHFVSDRELSMRWEKKGWGETME